MSSAMMSAPSAAKRTASARPCPRAAPVMKTTFLSKRRGVSVGMAGSFLSGPTALFLSGSTALPGATALPGPTAGLAGRPGRVQAGRDGAAVDAQVAAGDVARAVRREEVDGRRDVGRPAEPA